MMTYLIRQLYKPFSFFQHIGQGGKAYVFTRTSISDTAMSSGIHFPQSHARTGRSFTRGHSVFGWVAAGFVLLLSAGSEVARAQNAPTASPGMVTATEDMTYTFVADDFPFMDADGDSLASVSITTLPGNGELLLNSMEIMMPTVVTTAMLMAGNLQYSPPGNDNGTAYTTFMFTVNDGTSDSTTVTMTINVTAVNDAPTASPSTVTATEDTTYTFTVSNFPFMDVDGDTLASVSITTLPANGELLLNSAEITMMQTVVDTAMLMAGNLQYRPPENANGSPYTTFMFTVNDGTADSTPATMTINVTAVNDAPTASPGMVTATEDMTYTFMADDFPFMDVDSGDSLAGVSITTLPVNGELLLNSMEITGMLPTVVTTATLSAGNLQYRPPENANGSPYTTFMFTVNDGTADSTPATMTINVTAVNDAPTASANTVTATEDMTYTFMADDFPFMDVDSGDSLAGVSITTLPGNGELLLNSMEITGMLPTVVTTAMLSAGNLEYSPPGNDNGTAYTTFTFTVNDGTANSAAATMTIRVLTPITSGIEEIAPGVTMLELNEAVYAILGGHDETGALIDATVLLDEGLHGSLAACIVPGLVVESGVELNVGPCYQPPTDLTDATMLRVPYFGSVLYFIDRSDNTIRSLQRIYVAPSIGFVSGTQPRQQSDTMIGLTVQGQGSYNAVVDIEFSGASGAAVSFSRENRQAQEVMVMLEDGATTQVEITAINDIPFDSNGDAVLTADLTEAMLARGSLFYLGNRVIMVPVTEMEEERVIMSDEQPLMVAAGDAPTTITMTTAYPVEIFTYSAVAQSFVAPEPAVNSGDTAVASVTINADGRIVFLDRDDNIIDIDEAMVDLMLPILLFRVETADGIIEEEVVFGSTGEVIIMDSDFTLAQGNMALVGPYVSSGEGGQMARVTTETVTALNLPDLPDGRTASAAAEETGLFDFIVEVDDAGDVAVVILRLATAAREGDLYHKYSEAAGEWVQFDTISGNDRIYSAPMPCPSAGASREGGADAVSAWRPAGDGMSDGDRCLLLEIQDGAANDADGRANGYVVDIGGLALPTTGGSGRGGGVVELWWLLLGGGIFLSVLWMRRRLSAL